MHGESFLTIILPAWWVCTYTMRNCSCVLMKVMLKSRMINSSKKPVVFYSVRIIWGFYLIQVINYITKLYVECNFRWLYIIYFSKIKKCILPMGFGATSSHLLGAAMARARPATGVGLLQAFATWPSISQLYGWHLFSGEKRFHSISMIIGTFPLQLARYKFLRELRQRQQSWLCGAAKAVEKSRGSFKFVSTSCKSMVWVAGKETRVSL